MTAVQTAVAIFTGKCGENSEATSEYGLAENQEVQLNGNTDLSSCIRANDDACVFGIRLAGSPGPIYDYVIEVDARGPKGFGSGSMYLAFTDETGDTCHLFVYSSHRSVHTVRCNSEKPTIKKIRWSNKPID